MIQSKRTEMKGASLSFLGYSQLYIMRIYDHWNFVSLVKGICGYFDERHLPPVVNAGDSWTAMFRIQNNFNAIIFFL
jgi:hypothetical protein